MGIHGVVKMHWQGAGMTHALTRLRYRNATSTDLTADQVAGAVAASVAGMAILAANVPSVVEMVSDPEVVCYDDVTGLITSVVIDTADAVTTTGSAAGAFASGVGARVLLHTAGIVRGRRVLGGLMLVPLGGGTYDDNGNITTGAAANLVSAVETFGDTGSGAQLVVWTRSKPARGLFPALDGMTSDVESASCDSPPGVLRRRRF